MSRIGHGVRLLLSDAAPTPSGSRWFCDPSCGWRFPPPDFLIAGDDARKIGRTSGRSAKVEVLPRAEQRRSWTIEQKREIVSESLGSDLTPTEIARKHAISSTPGVSSC